ncbi:S-layer homology domain-containing protein [Virgibacillus necropolis]|uniref:S-layer homology domain-containing protein n=1 Tax=Virgibacillus necropolis TaxID=163877 RepID=UPI00384AE7E9
MKWQKRYKVSIQVFILVILIVLAGSPLTVNAATINEQFKVSQGVNYKDIRFSDGETNKAVRVMEINMNDPYTSVEVGIPSVLNQVHTTTSLALDYHQEGHAVLGAINGSFFHLGTAMNLVSKNNRLVHAGEVFAGESNYVNEPIAFGINANGKGVIDYYQLEMKYIHNNKSYDITSTNKTRSPNNTILYTSHFSSQYTETNKWGTEIVVKLPSAPSLEYGSVVTGTVESIRNPGDTTETVIPKKGFVLSAHGTGSDKMKGIEIGDSIKLSIDIDEQWKNSSFMLASGPMLVEDGKVSLTMDPNSDSARTRAPRTAVAIDRTGEKVFFVTVDGRQEGYSNGINLTEFAEYLVSMGAYRALNMDGGGSTTMAVRYPGTEKIMLANLPSDGYERSVSTILMAVSTAPEQVFPDVSLVHWAFPAIMYLYNNGTISGHEDGHFRPDESISRQHAALMLTRELNLDTSNVTNPMFVDVKPTDKFYKEIAAVENEGLFQGRGDKVFAKNANLTRAEIAVIIQIAYGIPKTNDSYFSDVKSSHWASSFINAIAQSGISMGYPDGEYKPSENVTRAEFSIFINKAESQQ